MNRISVSCIAAAVTLLFAIRCHAQDIASPLTIQGMTQQTFQGVRSLGMGSASIATGSDASCVFGNPASLANVKSLDVRISGTYRSTSVFQTQQWVPNRVWPGLSILFEDLWGGIKNPQLNDSTPVTDPFEKLQKGYDAIPANWSAKTSNTSARSFAVAYPVQLENISLVGGFGYSEVLNPFQYYINNNALSPELGEYRPAPIPTVKVGDTLRVQWYRFFRSREGTIYGATPSLAAKFGKEYSIGIAATIFSGSTNDFEERIDRGRLVMIYNRFKVDSVYFHQSKKGTSQYSGVSFNIGGLITKEFFSLGVSITPPMTITREWSRTVQTDSTGVSRQSIETGKDKLALPLEYAIGMTLTPSSKWTLSIDYVSRHFQNAEYTDGAGSVSQPLLSDRSLRGGVEFTPAEWLSLRGGYRQDVQVFAPANAGLATDPVMGQVYTAGLSVTIDRLVVEAAYNYTKLEYQDMWASNINDNISTRHDVVFGVGYTF